MPPAPPREIALTFEEHESTLSLARTPVSMGAAELVVVGRDPRLVLRDTPEGQEKTQPRLESAEKLSKGKAWMSERLACISLALARGMIR